MISQASKQAAPIKTSISILICCRNNEKIWIFYLQRARRNFMSDFNFVRVARNVSNAGIKWYSKMLSHIIATYDVFCCNISHFFLFSLSIILKWNLIIMERSFQQCDIWFLHACSSFHSISFHTSAFHCIAHNKPT